MSIIITKKLPMKLKSLCFLFGMMVLPVFLLAQNQKPVSRKNVLFIAVDDLKPLIGAYGDRNAITPNMDRLAKEGFVFMQAYTEQAVCAPSRASMLTGLRPDYTKVWDLHTQIRDKNPDVITLPQLFKENGYITYGIGKIFDPRSVDHGHDSRSWTIPYVQPAQLPWSVSRPLLGYYRSPEHEAKIRFYEDLAKANGLKGRQVNNFVRKHYKPSTEKVKGPDDIYLDGVIAKEALNKLDRFAKQKKPFMLMVGFKKPHLPFVAPAKYWDLYDEKKLPVAKFQKHSKGGPALAYHHSPELRSYTDIPPVYPQDGVLEMAKQRHLIHGYYACASYVDAQIGKLLDKLKQTGLDKNTIIVLWGDHGWHLGDHNLWTKHTNFEQATRLPLMIYNPGMKPGKTDIPVESLDIFPTVCQMAGIRPDKAVQGFSLVPLMEGKKPKQDYAISQWPTRGGKGGMGYSIRTRRFRYTEWYEKYKSTQLRNHVKPVAAELYDYVEDPLETHNLVKNKKYATVLKRLQDTLHRFLDSQAASATGNGTAGAALLTATANEIPGHPSGPPLRRLVAQNFKPGTVYIGATIDNQSIGTPKSKLLAEQFSYTTPANAAKQHAVHPMPGKWNWQKIDKVVGFAQKNNLVVRLHGPISPQCSPWAKDDSRTPAELLQNMTEYMTAECKHFRGNKTVKWMDVVNETVDKNGKWFGPKPGTRQWENPWLKIGLNKEGIPIYIVKAFEIATKYADPDIKLVYNQHLTMNPVVWEKVKTTVLYLKKKGLRVDAIGWQAHLKENDNVGLDPKALAYLGKLIDWTHAHGMEFHVTELDDKVSGTFNDEEAQKQAMAYANILKVLLSKRQSGTVACNTWGLQDGSGKYNNGHRYMFDHELRAKPAYYAFQKVLENPGDLKLVFPQSAQAGTEAAHSANLLKNGSFEDKNQFWIQFGSVAFASNGEQKSGRYCVKIAGDRSGIKQVIGGLKPHTEYRLSGWIKAGNGERVVFKVLVKGQKPVVAATKSEVYKKVTLQFNTGDARQATIMFQKWGSGNAPACADNLVLEKL